MVSYSACPSIRGARTSRVRQATGTTSPPACARAPLGRKTPARLAPPPAHLKQIHLIGRPNGTLADDADAQEPMSRKVAHLALAVTSLSAAKNALDQRDIPYTIQTAAVGAEQVFFFDPFGNQIELQEARER